MHSCTGNNIVHLCRPPPAMPLKLGPWAVMQLAARTPQWRYGLFSSICARRPSPVPSLTLAVLQHVPSGCGVTATHSLWLKAFGAGCRQGGWRWSKEHHWTRPRSCHHCQSNLLALHLPTVTHQQWRYRAAVTPTDIHCRRCRLFCDVELGLVCHYTTMGLMRSCWYTQDGSGAANSARESPDADADGAAPAPEKASAPEPADAGTDKTLEGVVQVCSLQQ